MANTINTHRLVNDCITTTKLILPNIIPNNHDIFRACLIFILSEFSAQGRFGACDMKEVRLNRHSLITPGTVTACDIDIAP